MPELSLNLDPFGGLWPVMPAQVTTPDEDAAINFGALIQVQARLDEPPVLGPMVQGPQVQGPQVQGPGVALPRPALTPVEQPIIDPVVLYVAQSVQPRPLESPGERPLDLIEIEGAPIDAPVGLKDESPVVDRVVDRVTDHDQVDFTQVQPTTLSAATQAPPPPDPTQPRGTREIRTASISEAPVQIDVHHVEHTPPVRRTDPGPIAHATAALSSLTPATPATPATLAAPVAAAAAAAAAVAPLISARPPTVPPAVRPVERGHYERMVADLPTEPPAPFVAAQPVEGAPRGATSPDTAPAVAAAPSLVPEAPPTLMSHGPAPTSAPAPAPAQVAPAPLQALVPTTEDGTPVTARLVDMMRWQAQEGGGQAELRLRPEFLGAVTVSIVVERGGVKAIVSAETTAALEYLRSESSALREALEERGLTLDEFEVREESPLAERRRDAKDAPPRQETAPPAPRRRPSGADGEAVFNVLM